MDLARDYLDLLRLVVCISRGLLTARLFNQRRDNAANLCNSTILIFFCPQQVAIINYPFIFQVTRLSDIKEASTLFYAFLFYVCALNFSFFFFTMQETLFFFHSTSFDFSLISHTIQKAILLMLSMLSTAAMCLRSRA